MADGDDTISVDPIPGATPSDPPPAAAKQPETIAGATEKKAETPAPEESTADMGRLAVEHYKRAEDQMKAMNDKLEPLYDQLQQKLQEPAPQMPKLKDIPQSPDMKAINQQLEKGRFAYLAIGGVLAAMLGRKGRNASWLAMGAFGKGLEALGQQNQAAASDQFKQWQEAAANVKQQNSEQLAQYKEVLENRKLNLDQQMQLIGIIAKQYGNRVYEEDTEGKNIVGLMNHLGQQEKKGQEWDHQTQTSTKAYLRKLGGSEEGRAYGSFIQSKYGFDPYESEDSLKKAEEKFPYSRWDSEYQKQKSTHGDESAGEEDPLGLKGGEVNQSGAQKTLEDIGILGGG